MQRIQDESIKVSALHRAQTSLAGSDCSEITPAPPCKKDRWAGEPLLHAIVLTC